MTSMSRREAVRNLAGAAAAIALPSATRAAAPRRKPNILFVLADDLGYGDLGCYGQERIQTPHIDRLAAEGVRFTDCYAGSTVCAPSRCALMTGLHTGHCRVRGNARVPLLPEDVTVAEVLKGAGYATGIVGKWGLGEPDTTGIPTRQGFDYWFGYLNQGHAHTYYPDYLWRNEERVPIPGNEGGGKGEYSHDLFTQEALDFIHRQAGGPFFLYLAYTIPHANNELGAQTGNGMEVPSDIPYSDQPWPQPQRNHAAMITRMDRDIGSVMRLLKEVDVDRDTVVLFTSDNGPHKEGGGDPAFFRSSGPLRGYKRDLYEGGIRVPMIVRWPGLIGPGRASDQVWSFWDLLPTAASIAGVKPPAGLDGISMLPALLGRKQRQPEYLYWEFHERGFEQAVRMGQWKAVRHGIRKPTELYDLANDLAETADIAASHPEVITEIEAILGECRTESKEFPVREK
jgi:arylsulfatase A-like enzyme